MKSEPRKQQLTVTLSDCTRSSSVANAKIYVLLYSFRFAYFEFEGNFQVQAPGGLYSEGRFNGGFFCVMSLGGLYLEGLIFGISRYTSARTWNLAPNFLNKTGFWRGHFWTSSLSDKNHFFAMSWKRLLSVVALCETCDQALFFRGKGGKSTRLPNKNGRKTA